MLLFEQVRQSNTSIRDPPIDLLSQFDFPINKYALTIVHSISVQLISMNLTYLDWKWQRVNSRWTSSGFSETEDHNPIPYPRSYDFQQMVEEMQAQSSH